MIGITTPQAAGISELEIQGFMRQISRRGITMHCVVMLRGNDIFFELTTIQQNRTSSARWWSGCVPEEDFIFVCTGDNQYNDMASEIIFRAVFDHLIPDEPAQGEKTFELSTAFGEIQSDFAGKISGETFDCGENPMGMNGSGWSSAGTAVAWSIKMLRERSGGPSVWERMCSASSRSWAIRMSGATCTS